MTPTKRPPDATRAARQQVTAARERARMAIHEAAHSVAAVLLGGHVELARLDPDGRLGEGLTTVSEDSLTADAHALVAHAGPYAEARFDAGRRPTVREIDRAYIRSGHGDAALVAAAGGSIQADVSRVEKVIEDNWDTVITVAPADRQGRLRHPLDCLQCPRLPERRRRRADLVHVVLHQGRDAPGALIP